MSDAHPSVALDDIQGIVRFGYKQLPEASFLLLRVRDRAAARAWLARAPVTSAATVAPPPSRALQVALTSEGMLALGVPRATIEGFSAEFLAGMGSDTSRARRLGDVGPNAPSAWRWGAGAAVPHLLLMVYARAGDLAAWQAEVEAGCAAGFAPLAQLPCSGLRAVEHFGFADGISQPAPDWQRTRPAVDAEQPAYDNLACLGEFLLGYPNEYGGYTDRPLLPAAAGLPEAEEAPGHGDLGKNGSYLVLRQLEQDVPGFWQCLHRLAEGDAVRREQLATAMVGRTREGVSLVQDAPAGGAAVDLNDFTYDADPQGLRCPLGAHVRRANPRSTDLPATQARSPGALSWLKRTLGFDAEALALDQVASTRFHRLLRRGREYGEPVALAQALNGPAPHHETGLYFVCLNANIARQFEFVQSAWLASTHFNGLHGEADPLLGTRQPGPGGRASDAFAMPQTRGPDQRLAGLPPFVTLRGGGYFFLPGLRALRYLAQAR